MALGLVHRHKHKRKVVQEAGAPADIGAPAETVFKTLPHSKLWEEILDRVTLVAGVIGPLMVIPQIYQIFNSHNATGVSALSWGAFAVLDVPFIIYGIFHKDRPIVITYTMFCIANIVVAMGAILYG